MIRCVQKSPKNFFAGFCSPASTAISFSVTMGLNRLALRRFISSSDSFFAATAAFCFFTRSLFGPLSLIALAASLVQGRFLPPKIEAELLNE